MTAPIDAASRPASFALAVPGFTPAWRRARASQPVDLPSLARLVRRGGVSRVDAVQPGWKPERLRLLGLLGLPADARLGGAALTWLGLGAEPQRGGWLQAEFVHLEVGSHNARLHAITGLDGAEAAQLASHLHAGLQFAGFTVLPSPDPQACPGVFLHSERTLDVVCASPGFDDLVELRDVLPQGKDGPLLRRLLTEAQMLLHDHPVNAARERRKQRTANAIWLTGVSEFAGLQSASLPAIASDDVYLKGLCRLHGQQALPVPASAAAAISGTQTALVELALLGHSDPVAHLTQLERDWIAPLVAAVGSGRINALAIQLDDLEIRIDRPALRRFWRRGRPLAEWLQ